MRSRGARRACLRSRSPRAPPPLMHVASFAMCFDGESCVGWEGGDGVQE